LDKVKINLFGESWSLKKLELDYDLKEKVNSLINRSANELGKLLLDLSFYEELNIPGIKSIADLPGTSIKGLHNTSKNQVEIWLNGKKIIKIKLKDLFHQNTLFKLYQTEESIVNFEDMSEGIYVFDNEIGLTACYQYTAENFKIDQLTFSLLKFQNDDITNEILTSICWKNQLLTSIRSDTVVTNSNCIIKSC